MNATLKSWLTKTILCRVSASIAEGKEFHEVQTEKANWVEVLQEIAKIYNNTPKAATGLTPMEVHFPNREHYEMDEHFFQNERDKQILTAIREEVNIL